MSTKMKSNFYKHLPVQPNCTLPLVAGSLLLNPCPPYNVRKKAIFYCTTSIPCSIEAVSDNGCYAVVMPAPTPGRAFTFSSIVIV